MKKSKKKEKIMEIKINGGKVEEKVKWDSDNIEKKVYV